MGMFSFLKKKDEPVIPVHDVSLQELPSWYEEATMAEFREKKQEAERMYNSLLDKVSDIRTSLDVLDSARITGVERLHIASNMIKETFVKKKYPHLNSLNTLREGFRPEYEFFMTYQTRVLQTLAEMKGSTPKQTILLSRYFKKETQGFVDAMNKAEEASRSLKEYLVTGSGSFSTMARIKRQVRDSRELIKESNDLSRKITDLEAQVKEFLEKRSELEKGFLKLIKSKEWKKMNKLREEESALRESARQAEARLETELASISRPLKRLESVMARKVKVSPIHKNSIRDFTRDPMKVLLSEKGQESLLAAIKSVKKKGIDPRENIDLESIIERISRDAPDFRDHYLEEKGNLDKATTKLRDLERIKADKRGIEERIKMTSEEAGNLEDELRKARSRKTEIKDAVSGTLRGLERMILEENQKRVKIRV